MSVTFFCANPMESIYCFAIRPFGFSLQITSDSYDLHALAERYVLPSLTRIEIGSLAPDVAIRAFRNSGRFHLSVDGVVAASADQPRDLVPSLVNVIDEAVVNRLDGLHAAHAGAVLLRGRALLLPGISHSGKSSLVAELLRQGAQYFSDEYALIDSAGRVHPYARPLLLRNGSPQQSPVLPEECNSSVAQAPAPVGWILMLEYSPRGSWSISPVPQSLALMALLKNTPHSLAQAPQMTESFRRAVEGARCFAGSRADAVAASAEILRLVNELS